MGIMELIKILTPWTLGACAVVWGGIITVWVALFIYRRFKNGRHALKPYRHSEINNGDRTIGNK